jgi:hypothetical protein
MLGILLVSKGVHSGRQLIMTYPHTLYKEHLTYFDSVHNNKSLSAKTSAEASTSMFVLGFPSSVLADVLCPKKELWDQVLDISIENLRFISYPIGIKPKEDKETQFFPLMSFPESPEEKENIETISTFNVVLVYEQRSGMVLPESEIIKEAAIRLSKDLFRHHT